MHDIAKKKPTRIVWRRHAGPLLVMLTGVAIIGTKNILQAQVNLDEAPQEMAIEHTEPGELAIDVSTLHGVGLLEITTSGSGAYSVSLPATWLRGEVRDAPLSSIVSEPPTLGFTRWTIPGEATVAFRLREVPSGMLLHHPSTHALKVTLTRVNLETEVVERNVILVQEGTTTLW
jgi:hypothetical protein